MHNMVEYTRTKMKELRFMGINATLTREDERFLKKSLNGPVWKVILSIGTPLALYEGLSMLFAILDTMMAAHISKESVSAVAYLTQINGILSSVGGGLAVGASILISHAYGSGDYPLVRRMVSSLYVLCLAVGLAMLALILPFTGQFLRLAGTPDSLITIGSQYFVVQMFVMVVTFLNNVYIAVERARGNAKLIFRLNLMTIFVKLSLTAYFVYVIHSGLVMIALASLASQCALLAVAVRNSVFCESAFSFSAKAVTFRREITLPMLERSVPVMAEKALFSFGKTIVNAMCTFYGDVMVGAMGISNNLGGITTNPQFGYQEGAQAIISQNLGAGKRKRVLEAFYATLVIEVILSTVISGLELWQLDWLAGLFDSGSSEFHRMIMTVYRYEALGAVPLGINSAVMALLYGLGKTKLTLLLNVSRVFVFRIPLFWFLQHCTTIGEASVGIVMMASNISITVMAVVIGVIVIHKFKTESGFAFSEDAN